MNPQQPHFEEPSLRRALRDLAGQESAPTALRARVAARMAAERVDEPGAERPLTIGAKPSLPLKRLLAMAAMIVIGVSIGLGGYNWYLGSELRKKSLVAQNAVVVPSLWESMVNLHECGVDGGKHQTVMIVSATEPDAVAAEASTKFGRRVPKPEFPGTAWKLDASSFGDIGGFPGARFHLSDGARAITVVSLPESAWAYRNADTYTTTVDSHQIAGYVKDGGLHCVIGDRGVPLAEIQALADRLRVQ
jgi:hypothetical protein